MFDQNSRYYRIKEAVCKCRGTGKVVYKRRRFLPQVEDLPMQGEVTVAQGDRPDLAAERTIREPEQYWQICDANNAVNPFGMTAQPGKKLNVPEPEIER